MATKLKIKNIDIRIQNSEFLKCGRRPGNESIGVMRTGSGWKSFCFGQWLMAQPATYVLCSSTCEEIKSFIKILSNWS